MRRILFYYLHAGETWVYLKRGQRNYYLSIWIYWSTRFRIISAIPELSGQLIWFFIFIANGKCTMDYKQLSENERYQIYMLNKAGHNQGVVGREPNLRCCCLFYRVGFAHRFPRFMHLPGGRYPPYS